MTIFVKNKHTLQIDEFKFRCCIGKKGTTINKKEGDEKGEEGICSKFSLLSIMNHVSNEGPRVVPPRYRRVLKFKYVYIS